MTAAQIARSAELRAKVANNVAMTDAEKLELAKLADALDLVEDRFAQARSAQPPAVDLNKKVADLEKQVESMRRPWWKSAIIFVVGFAAGAGSAVAYDKYKE